MLTPIHACLNSLKKKKKKCIHRCVPLFLLKFISCRKRSQFQPGINLLHSRPYQTVVFKPRKGTMK